MIKKISILITAITGLLIGGVIAQAAPLGGGGGTITILPEFVATTSPSTEITQRTYGKALRLSGITTGCATFDSDGTITSTGSACGGSGSTFAWTPTATYNSTSTVIAFLQGLFSTASSTFNGPLFITNLSQGLLYNGRNGLTQTVATSSAICSGSASCLPFTVVGSVSPDIAVVNTIANGLTGATSFPLNSIIGYDGSTLIATGTPKLTIGTLNATSTATSTFAGGINIGTNHLTAHGIISDASDGLHFHAANGTTVALLGAGNSANATFYGGLTVNGLATVDYLNSLSTTATSTFAASASTTRLLVGTGAEGYPSIIFAGCSTANCGFHLQGLNSIDVNTPSQFRIDINNSATVYDFQATQFLPAPNAANKLGAFGYAWNGLFASSTSYIDKFINTYGSSTALSVSSSFAVTPLTSALILTDAEGTFAEYAGATCTNQFIRSLSALGASTCATVVAGDVDLADLTATDGTLTFSGAYDGSTARTIGINLANPNSWTVLQTFTYASSTGLTASGGFGLTSTAATGTVTNAFAIGTTTYASTGHKLVIQGSVATQELRSATSSTVTVDWNNSNAQQVGLGANTTFVFKNAYPGGAYRLIVCQDGTGSRTGTWPNGSVIIWQDGTGPTLTTTAHKCDIFSFVYSTGTTSAKYFGAMSDNY